jgi:hypothetical protein
MTSTRNPGRVAGLWYLFLSVVAPLRLIYIPSKLFVDGNAAATASNIAAHEALFRFGIVADLVCAVILCLDKYSCSPVAPQPPLLAWETLPWHPYCV